MTLTKDLKDKLFIAAKEASSKAYSPYSKYQVGSAVLTEEKNIYSGCNIENSSYGATVCAERVAIFEAVKRGESKILAIYVYTKDNWPPCGMCRQVMGEFAHQNCVVIFGNGQKGQETEMKLSELLPLAFTPGHLKS